MINLGFGSFDLRLLSKLRHLPFLIIAVSDHPFHGRFTRSRIFPNESEFVPQNESICSTSESSSYDQIIFDL